MKAVKILEDKGLSLDARLQLAPSELLRHLTDEDVQLLKLKQELYRDSWERMCADLRDRLKSRPYMHRLMKRIETDLTVILKFQKYEIANKVNLADLFSDYSRARPL